MQFIRLHRQPGFLITGGNAYPRVEVLDENNTS